MVEEPDHARFAFRRHPINGKHALRLDLHSASAIFNWPATQEGRDDLDSLMERIERVVAVALREIDIAHEVDELDREIADFLTEDDE